MFQNTIWHFYHLVFFTIQRGFYLLYCFKLFMCKSIAAD